MLGQAQGIIGCLPICTNIANQVTQNKRSKTWWRFNLHKCMRRKISLIETVCWNPECRPLKPQQVLLRGTVQKSPRAARQSRGLWWAVRDLSEGWDSCQSALGFRAGVRWGAGQGSGNKGETTRVNIKSQSQEIYYLTFTWELWWGLLCCWLEWQYSAAEACVCNILVASLIAEQHQVRAINLSTVTGRWQHTANTRSPNK